MEQSVSSDVNKGFIIQQNPSGKPEFAVQFDVKDFKPEEVNVSTKDGKLVIAGKFSSKHIFVYPNIYMTICTKLS